LRTVRLPEGRVWLRVADPEWTNPLDPSFAAVHGGRWNPPGSFPVLYLNADVSTASMRLARMLEGWPVSLDDLDDEGFVLVAATLPRAQDCADAVSAEGLVSLGLPATYPHGDDGIEVTREVCQLVGEEIKDASLRGVWCRSACSEDGRGRELGWFPASRRSTAKPVWGSPLPLARWREADSWTSIGLDEQPDPSI
jgi:hypothetical protein